MSLCNYIVGDLDEIVSDVYSSLGSMYVLYLLTYLLHGTESFLRS